MDGEDEPGEKIHALEKQLERHQERIKQQKQQIERLQRDETEQIEHEPDRSDNETGRHPNQDTGRSRRDYLKLAALGGVSVGIGGLAYSLADDDQSTNDDQPNPINRSNELRVNDDGSIQGKITGNKRLTNISGSNLWIDSNGQLNAEGAGTGSLNDGGIVAKPGSVQEAIDRVASNGGGIVRLNSTRTYTQNSSFPWHVKPEVILDFNGATLYGSGAHPDVDIIHLHPQGQVHNPKIDLWDEFGAYSKSNPYSGNVFTLDGKYGAYFADGTTVRGGWTKAVEAEGTWMYFGKNNASDYRANHITSITIDTNLRKPNEPNNVGSGVIDTGIHLDSSGPNGYLNSIIFRGVFRGAKKMILQEGSQPNNAHIFDGVFQQPDDSEYLWRIAPNTFSRETVVRGKVWDVNTKTYPDGVAWLIDSQHDEAGGNAINATGIDPSFVQNNSDNDQHITNPVTNETTIV